MIFSKVAHGCGCYDGSEIEIGHVLFIDIVGYSKLLIGEQSELVRELREVVATSEQVRVAEEHGRLVSLPTGDGVALVFRDSAEAPAHCALEIAHAVKKYPKLRLRMGIHSGPVNMVDLNNPANTAERKSTSHNGNQCGDAGHILVSEHISNTSSAMAGVGFCSCSLVGTYAKVHRNANCIAVLRRR